MSFYGIKVRAGKTSWVEGSHEEPIQLTNACLFRPGRSKEARIVVRICDESQDADGSIPVMAVLSAGPKGLENINLDLLINSRMGISLAGTGIDGAEVHFVGRVVPEEPDDDIFPMMHDEGMQLPEGFEREIEELLNAGGVGSASDSSDDDDFDIAGDDSDDAMDDDDDDDDDDNDKGGSDAHGAAGTSGQSAEEQEKAVVPRKGGGVRTHPSGVKIQDLLVGVGKAPTKGRNVAIEYKLRVESGKVVDKSGKNPFKFRLGIGEVIKGMDIGVSGMREGGERHLIIPPELGYGKRGAPPKIPKNAMLFFDVKLVHAW